MKTYGGLLWVMVIAFATVANSLMPSKKVDSLALLGTVTKTPTKRATQIVPPLVLTKLSNAKTPVGQTNIPVVNFDRSSMNSVAPADILDILAEINIFGANGGPDIDDTPVSLCANGRYTQPVIVRDPLDRTQARESWMITCGWAPKQKLTGQIISPDGSIYQETITADRDGEGTLYFQPADSNPRGMYTFEIFSRDVLLRSNAYFWKPRNPRVFVRSGNQLIVEHFYPNETLRLFAYTCRGSASEPMPCKLHGWANYRIPEAGTMVIQIQDVSKFYRVVDSYGYEFKPDSHALPYQIGKKTAQLARLPTLPCPPKIYQVQNKTARVKADGPGIHLYANPRTSARVISSLPPGQLLVFLDVGMPLCSEGKVWWRILAPGNKKLLQGFVVELDGNKSYIELLESK